MENLRQGAHEFLWDGRDEEGDLMPDGLYQYGVYAKTDSGEDISVSYSKNGQVSMVRFEGADPMVQINGEWMAAKEIMSIDDRSTRRYDLASPLPLRTELESRKPGLEMLNRVKAVQLD